MEGITFLTKNKHARSLVGRHPYGPYTVYLISFHDTIVSRNYKIEKNKKKVVRVPSLISEI
jgi:hypothetical protein